jgi:glutamine amidotransferase
VVTLVDYGASNLKSVQNALAVLGVDTRVADRAEAIRDAGVLVLPGVGAFGDGMAGLRSRGLIEPLGERVQGHGVPFLGICLGMQFLADEGLEHGRHAGLGWIGGTVRRIEPEDRKFRVPHIGWNDVRLERPGLLLDGLDEAPTFYFVHGYHLDPGPRGADAVTSTCWHGSTLVATVERGHVFGVQFHPEKSQRAGLRVLENFLRHAGVRCSRSV